MKVHSIVQTLKNEVMKMRLIDADKGLISKIQRETGCNFITAQKIVDSMSVVEERKVGKWIKSGGSFRCSECIAMPEFTDIRTLKYCPNCGAEMVGYENG